MPQHDKPILEGSERTPPFRQGQYDYIVGKYCPPAPTSGAATGDVLRYLKGYWQERIDHNELVSGSC